MAAIKLQKGLNDTGSITYLLLISRPIFHGIMDFGTVFMFLLKIKQT